MIETHQYSEFSVSVFKQINSLRIPVNGTIEISNRCPLECVHCYNNLPMGDASARKRELTTEEHFRLLDELAELGCLWLLFTGGEIFARHGFLDLLRYLHKRGSLSTPLPNGT